MTTPLLLATDFSGLGSPEEAIKRLGVPYRVVFACERDKYARNSYYANHEPEIFYDDVTTRNNDTAPYSDCYVFGFPCQAFSIAGKQLGFEDMRGTLVFNSADYIRKKKPRTFIAENVKGLLSHDGGRTFRTIIDTFAISENGAHNMFQKVDCLGYHVFYQVHNTKNYGIPQNRERIFIIGFRDEADALRFSQPKGFPLLLKLKDLLQDNPHSKYYLSETALNRLARRENYVPQINPDIIGTINTKNNSGQLSYDNGTTLIYDVPEKYYLSDNMLS
jgi:DNA (cytosine-5)-methyltransferase 1